MANYNIQNSSFIKAYNSGRFREDVPGMHPPADQNFFNFIEFFRKYY